MPRAQVRVHSAASGDVLARISTELPDAEFRILASHTTDDGLLGIAEVTTADDDALVRHFAQDPEVDSFEVVHSDDRATLIQYVIPVPASYREVLRSGVLPRFPAVMRDGWLHFEKTAPQERLAQYVDALSSAGVTYEIESLTQSYDTVELLTDRQREFVSEAIDRGYYDDPRTCTLTELAEAFEVNSSAASGILHRAEGRVMKAFLGTPDTDL